MDISKGAFKKLAEDKKSEFLRSDGEFFEQTLQVAEDMNKQVNILLALGKDTNTTEIASYSPECLLEDEAFCVDSLHGWAQIALEDSTGNPIIAKVNPQRDIWELDDGTQLFLPTAMIRETRKVGREQDMMTGQQAEWLMKNSPNGVPEGCKFRGFLNSADGKIHFSQENACYWLGEPEGLDRYKALFCVDISTVDEDMRPHVDEMIVSDYDILSAMQVWLVQKKSK